MKNKPKAIYQDQRIAEEWCNFKCEYCEGFCPTEYSLKQDKDGQTYSNTKLLDEEERINEIATMLSGDHITKEALDNARTLLKR